MLVGVDCETLLIEPTMPAPPVVCVQVLRAGGEPQLVTRSGGALEEITLLLRGPDVLVLHNAAYDACCWALEPSIGPDLVFDKFERGEILCTYVFERLGEIAGYSTRKKLDLATCCQAHGIPAPSLKDAGLATGFGQFIEAAEIPEPYRQYALEDTIVLKLFERQRARFKDVPMAALQRLTYRQFVLALASVTGMPVDADAAEALAADAQGHIDYLRPLAEEWGFVRKDGTKCMAAIRAAVEECYGRATPRTATGLASTSRLTLEQADSPKLQAFALWGEWTKTLTNDVPNIMAGSGVVRTRYGLADTTRTTSSGGKKGERTGVIAMQNLKQSGGIRECLVPPEGHCFYVADIAGAEICALAQVCIDTIGRSDTADLLSTVGRPGELPTIFGAMLARQDVDTFRARYDAKEQAAVEIRTRAKNAIYGFMGGMGYKTYVDYVRILSKGKTVITFAESLDLRDAWREMFPDFYEYLVTTGKEERSDGTFDIILPGYDIPRRRIWYSAACNNRFQSLIAAAASEVSIDAQRECWTGALWPARLVLHVHDEWILSVPTEDVDAFDRAFLPIAKAAALRIMPDVPTVWEAEACSVYSKKAKRVVDAAGRLQVWHP